MSLMQIAGHGVSTVATVPLAVYQCGSFFQNANNLLKVSLRGSLVTRVLTELTLLLIVLSYH